jgi:hypothetical protein
MGNRFRVEYLIDVGAGELEADLGEAVAAARVGEPEATKHGERWKARA